MRQKMVWRYYCDHCAKGGCGKGAMAKHELSCARNPERVCRMCKHGELTQQPMALLREAAHGIDGLRIAANGCPACMLAAAIQEHQTAHNGDPEEDGGVYVDFRTEAKRFWEDVNDRQTEREGRFG